MKSKIMLMNGSDNCKQCHPHNHAFYYDNGTYKISNLNVLIFVLKSKSNRAAELFCKLKNLWKIKM